MIRSPRPRRCALALAAALATLLVSPVDAATSNVRDLGEKLGLPQRISSWDVRPRDWNDDGWPDLLISHHGDGTFLYKNVHRGGRSLGFRKVYAFRDTIHHWNDRHGCAWSDVNLDGFDDLFCMTGAERGTVKKWNQLFVQGPRNQWTDMTHHYGLEDVWGRGRRPAFLNLNGDRWPDVFLGNDYPRQDDHRSPDRTFVNVHGDHFEQVFMGVTHELGARCVQATDLNRDGFDDLVLCGEKQLYLFINKDGRFVDKRRAYGLPPMNAAAARVADVNHDGRSDIVVVQLRKLRVWLRGPDARFHGPVEFRTLARGHWVAVADVNGDRRQDIFVVQACSEQKNVKDVLLLNSGDGKHWSRSWGLPAVTTGCGDVAAPIDFDRDGREDLVVLNGGFVRTSDIDKGPDQVLTTGAWRSQG